MPPPPPKPIGLPPERMASATRSGTASGPRRWGVVGHAQVRHTGRPAQQNATLAGLGRLLDADGSWKRLAGGNRAERALEAIEKIAAVEIADGNDEGVRRGGRSGGSARRGRPGRCAAGRTRSR